jgi:hypothetical protein
MQSRNYIHAADIRSENVFGAIFNHDHVDKDCLYIVHLRNLFCASSVDLHQGGL